MDAKRIAEIARGLVEFRAAAIYALIACAALSFALFSCNQPSRSAQKRVSALGLVSAFDSAATFV